MPRNDGGPAFGGAYDKVFGEDNGKGPLHKIEVRVKGMSLRDYFAIHAPTPTEEYLKIFAKARFPGESFASVEDLARWKYIYADAMLKEREK